MGRDDRCPRDWILGGHFVEHQPGRVWSGAPAVHGDKVVVEDSIFDKYGVRGGDQVVVDEATLGEGTEAGARDDEGGVCGGGKKSGRWGGRERLEGVEGGREMARVVELENGAVGVLHLRRFTNRSWRRRQAGPCR